MVRAYRRADLADRDLLWALVAAMCGVLTIFMFAPEMLDRHYTPEQASAVCGVEAAFAVAGVEASLLQPRLTWADPEAYDAKARELADMFRDNFSKFIADDNIVAGGPS